MTELGIHDLMIGDSSSMCTGIAGGSPNSNRYAAGADTGTRYANVSRVLFPSPQPAPPSDEPMSAPAAGNAPNLPGPATSAGLSVPAPTSPTRSIAESVTR